MSVDYEGDSQGVGDAKRVKRTQRVAKAEENLDDDYLRQVLDTVAGRAVFWRLLELCHPFRQSFVKDNTHLTAYNEGERHIGTELFEMILRVKPEIYITMQSEAEKREDRKKERVDGR